MFALSYKNRIPSISKDRHRYVFYGFLTLVSPPGYRYAVNFAGVLFTKNCNCYMYSFLDVRFLDNTVKDWGIALAIVLGTFIIVAIGGTALLNRLKRAASRTENHYDDIVVLAVEKFVFPLLYIGGVYMAFSYLSFSARINKGIHAGLLLVYTYFILRIITSIIQYMVTSFLSKQEGGDTKKKQAKGFIIIAKFIVWVLGFVFVLDNMGFNVSAIIAGLGVGGIAIALAAQTVLGDLFAYFIIFFDRPFEIGDFIVFDTETGVVEYIGVKSTRIRTLNGQLLICSNKDLTNARVNNYRNMVKRRVVFKIGIEYSTPSDMVAAVPEMVKTIVTSHEKVEFDRGHFSGFGDSSLNFEFVYYILAPEYATYMDIQQSINLKLLREFEEKKIAFAFPSRTLYVQNLNSSSESTGLMAD